MKICNDSVKQAIDGGLNHLEITPEQKQAILAQCRPSVTATRPRVVLLKRAVAVAAAAAVFTMGGAGVLAQNPDLARRLGPLGHAAVSLLQPVDQVSVDNGIRMEVLAALSTDDVTAVYLILQDTTGQGRVTADVDLRHISISGATFSHAQVIDYDEVSGAATICLTGEGGEMDDRKISVSLRSFLSGWDYQEDAGPVAYGPEALAQLGLPAPQKDPSAEVHSYSSVGENSLIPERGSEDLPVLLPSDDGVPLPGAPWAQITAAGVVDGALHIQLLHDDQLGLYNQVTFYLTDAEGNVLETPNAVAEIGEAVKIAPHWNVCRRQEHILQLPEGVDPQDLRLHYDLSTYQNCQKGNWSVAFTLEPADEPLTLSCPMHLSGWDVETMQISPLGIALYGRADGSDTIAGADSVVIRLKDGTTAEFWSSSSTMVGNDIVDRQLFTRPLDLSQIESVTVNDIALDLPKAAE